MCQRPALRHTMVATWTILLTVEYLAMVTTRYNYLHHPRSEPLVATTSPRDLAAHASGDMDGAVAASSAHRSGPQALPSCIEIKQQVRAPPAAHC